VRQGIVIAAMYALIASASPPRAASAQDTVPDLERYLRQMGLSSKELGAAARGRAVAKLLPTRNGNDVTVFAVVGVRASRDTVVSYARDADRFLSANGRQFDVLGDPPESTDVHRVAFDESEYRDLRSCRPRDCRFKLPEGLMTAFAEQVDWSARDAKAQVDGILRDALVRLAVDYLSRGSPATLPYDDVRGVRSGDVFAEIAGPSTDLYAYPVDLERYLTMYPAVRPIGMHDYLYWAEDRFSGLRPTITLNHLVIHAPPGDTAGAVFIASKQLYSNHYFDGGFELITVVDASEAATQPAVYLLTVRRLRFDHLPRGLLNVRGRVRSRMVDATRRDLERHRAAIERSGDP
jgi:hypothetical protein